MKKGLLSAKYIILVILLIIFLCLNICIGSVAIPISDVAKVIFHRSSDIVYTDIVMSIRFPRALAAALVGGALALSGYSLQTFFRNPIAGPFILGISSGAKLMVAIMFVIVGSQRFIGTGIIMALLGALASMGFVLLLSKKVSSMSLLLVGGVMIGYICTAITDFLVTFADDSDIVNLHNWSKGSLAGMTWDSVGIMAVIILLVALCMFLVSKQMMAYIMGESYARSLGVNITRFRIILILLSSILAATVTAFVGPVSFVGIAVPHLTRGFLKETRPIFVLPACFLLGAVFTLICDLIARYIFAPTELSISTVTAVFGAPIVIYLLIRNKMGR